MKAASPSANWRLHCMAEFGAALVFLVSGRLAAQTNSCGDPDRGGMIRGRIVDMDHVPIQNSGATLLALKCQALADRDGHFALKGVIPGSYLLTGWFIGYYRFDTTVIVPARDTVTLDTFDWCV